MAEPFMGEIKLGGWNFAPRYWAFCNGATVGISMNQALFALLGTTYGGDGRTTFKLPDLRGRVAMNAGPVNPLGAQGGEATHTLVSAELPVHVHQLKATAATGTSASVLTTPWLGGTPLAYGAYPGTPAATMKASVISQAGAGAAHENRQPYQCLNYVIALSGIFPPRN